MRVSILVGMPSLDLSVGYDSFEELVDALEEVRDLWDKFEDGVVDLGPVLREVVLELAAVADEIVREHAA